MAQIMAQQKLTLGTGNTNNVPEKKASKSRNWCLTLNNYTKNELAQLYDLKLNMSINCFCFQEEKGENGTLHLQGCFSFKNAISFESIKKVSPRGHWEKAKNLKKALAYCCKEDTRNGKVYTHNYNRYLPLDDAGILEDMMLQNLDSFLNGGC